MSHRKALTRQQTNGIAGGNGTKQASDIAPILERLIATLNRIEGKLDKKLIVNIEVVNP